MLMLAIPQYGILYFCNLLNHENNTVISEKCSRKSDNHAAKQRYAFQFLICVQSHFNVSYNSQFFIRYHSHAGSSFTVKSLI